MLKTFRPCKISSKCGVIGGIAIPHDGLLAVSGAIAMNGRPITKIRNGGTKPAAKRF
jgi:hypothetical protein